MRSAVSVFIVARGRKKSRLLFPDVPLFIFSRCHAEGGFETADKVVHVGKARSESRRADGFVAAREKRDGVIEAQKR